MIFINFFILLVGVAWDEFAIYRGHWSYGEQFLLGLRVGYVPIEDIGFFLLGIYFVLVVYKLVEKLSRL